MTHSVESKARTPRIQVLCLGNPDRGDDAAGLRVADLLKGRLPGHVEIAPCSGDLLGLIERWATLDALICVDAAQSLGAPGRVHRMDYFDNLKDRPQPVSSTHHLSLQAALDLASALDRIPETVIVIAIEAECFEFGEALTPAVANALSNLSEMVANEVNRLRIAWP